MFRFVILLLLAQAAVGCNPSRRPTRHGKGPGGSSGPGTGSPGSPGGPGGPGGPSGPGTPGGPPSPKTCAQLTLDSTCTDCNPETNSPTEIKCPATGNNLLLIIDAAGMKKPVTEAKCDTTNGKWVFKDGASDVAIEPAMVKCGMECERAGNCPKPCRVIPATTEFPSYCEKPTNTPCSAPTTNTANGFTCEGKEPTKKFKTAARNYIVKTMVCNPEGQWIINGLTEPAESVYCDYP